MTTRFFIVVCLVVAVNAGMGLIVPIMPVYLKSFGFSTAGLSLPFVSLIIGRIISKSFAAAIIGRLAGKGTLIVCFAIYAMTFAIYPHVDSAWGFTLLRFFEGVVEGISIICLTDLAIELSSKNRGKLMGIFGASFGVGFVIGPLVGGIIYKTMGVDAVFYGGAVIGLLSIIGTLFMPSVQHKVGKQRDLFSSLYRYREYIADYGPSIVRRATFFCFMMILPLYATETLGINVADVSLLFVISAVLSSCLMPITGGLADKYSVNHILFLTLLIMGISIIAFSVVDSIVPFIILFVIESVAFSFMLPAGMKVFADSVHDHSERTNIVSCFGSFTEVVTLLLALLIPFLYSVSIYSVWLFVGCFCLIFALPFGLRIRAANPMV